MATPHLAEPAWLSERVRSRLRDSETSRWAELRGLLVSLRLPNTRSVYGAAALLVVGSLSAWGLEHVSLGAPIPGGNVHDAYVTLWQVDASIAALALPILVFVIEFAKDRDAAAARSPEVLIRRSWIFPIIVFAMTVAVKIGVDIAWFQDPGVFIVDFVLFAATLVFVVLAFLTVLRLLFSPAAMVAAARELQKQRLTADIIAVIRSRVANAVLRDGLTEIGIEHDIYGIYGVERRPGAIELRSSRGGVLSDVNFETLRAMIAQLPRRSDPTASVGAPEAAPTPDRGDVQQAGIWFTKSYGELIQPASAAVLLLDRREFGSVDVGALQRVLDRAIKVDSADA
jgi:hypothetical protein